MGIIYGIQSNMGVSQNGGTPLMAGLTLLKWMMTGGTPSSGNYHVNNL